MALFDDSTDNEDKLDQDYDTPFSPADDQTGRIPIDHPSTDTGLDEHELYDEGLAGAAEAEEEDEEDLI